MWLTADLTVVQIQTLQTAEQQKKACVTMQKPETERQCVVMSRVLLRCRYLRGRRPLSAQNSRAVGKKSCDDNHTGETVTLQGSTHVVSAQAEILSLYICNTILWHLALKCINHYFTLLTQMGQLFDFRARVRWNSTQILLMFYLHFKCKAIEASWLV